MTDATSMHIERRWEISLLLFILFFSFAIRLPFLHEPPERDEGGYAYAGQEILRGAVLYKDVIEHKPPLLSYMYAGMFWLFGETTVAIKLFSSLYVLLTTVSVFFLSRYLFGSIAALWSAFLYGLFSSGPAIHGTAVEGELFFALPLTLSILAYAAAIKSNEKWFIASGFFATVAVLIKTTALPVFLLLFSILVIHRNPIKDRYYFVRDGLLLASGPAFCALILITYFSYNGALGDFFYWNVIYNFNMLGEGRASNFWPRLLGRGLQVSSEHLLLWMLSIAALIILFLRKRDTTTLLLSLWPVTSFLGVSMTGLFWPHYFQQMIPPLAVLSGFAITGIYNKEALKGGMKWIAIAITPFLISAGYGAVKNGYKYYLVYTPEEISRNKYGGDIFNDTLKVSEYIKDRTKPHDYVFQWGWEPQIYLLTNRRCPNKYPYMQVIDGAPDQGAAIEAMVNSIIAKRTKYIVIQKGREMWSGYEEIVYIVNNYYAFETEIGGMMIFRLEGT